MDGELWGWGEGGLWTTAHDLAAAVLAIQGSYLGRDHFLSHDLAVQMMTRQNERRGLGVQVDGSGDNLHFEHDGSTPGYKAKLFGYSSRGQGVVLLTNGDRGGELIENCCIALQQLITAPTFK